MGIYIFSAFIAVILSVVAQIILKIGSDKKNGIIFYGIRLNNYILLGYFLFVVVTLINLFAYTVLPLNYSMMFLPLIFILTIISAITFFKEKIEKIELIGIFIIILGVIVYSIN